MKGGSGQDLLLQACKWLLTTLWLMKPLFKDYVCLRQEGSTDTVQYSCHQTLENNGQNIRTSECPEQTSVHTSESWKLG